MFGTGRTGYSGIWSQEDEMSHINISFIFFFHWLKAKTLLLCFCIHAFGETTTSFCLFFLTVGAEWGSTHLITMTPKHTLTTLAWHSRSWNLFRTEGRKPCFQWGKKKNVFSWWIYDERGGSHFLLWHICSLTTNQWLWKLGTWMQNNGKMKWRLSSLGTLIFIESGKSDTTEDLVTFSHIRFFFSTS